jgi:uncharacterized protein (TIGR02246 family)
MRRRIIVGAIASLFVANAAGGLLAADSPQVLQKEIAASADRFEAAFEKRDAKALSELFTEDGEYVDDSGTVFHGRKAIADEFTAAFQRLAPGSMSVEILSIRPIAPGVAVDDGIATFKPKDQGTQTQTRFTSTFVKQADGSWLRASVRELSSGEATPGEHLKTLAWLTGRWRQESDSGKVDTEWAWSDDKNFLISRFSATQPNAEPFEGTHRIGWDGEREQFKSWVFTSTGGFAEGYWTVDANGKWLVELGGIEPDGQRMSTVISYVRDGADAMVISQERRTVGSITLPGFAHRVVRQPPAPSRPTAAR